MKQNRIDYNKIDPLLKYKPMPTKFISLHFNTCSPSTKWRIYCSPMSTVGWKARLACVLRKTGIMLPGVKLLS